MPAHQNTASLYTAIAVALTAIMAIVSLVIAHKPSGPTDQQVATALENICKNDPSVCRSKNLGTKQSIDFIIPKKPDSVPKNKLNIKNA